MTHPVQEVVHPDPVWRNKADFIIAAEIHDGGDIKTEQLWARRVADHRFELCCIPLFLYDVALGDIVSTGPDLGRQYLMTNVDEPSGRYVFRAWFGDSLHPRDEVATQLQDLGALIEWSSRNLLAVDAADAAHAQRVADFLAERERAGHLVYETGRR